MSGDIFDIDQGNRETITGTLHDPAATTGHVLTVQADKSIKAAPGGGSMPVQAGYAGNAVSIANGASADVTWDTLDGGTELLDRSVPDTPTFLADGWYAITASVIMDAITPGGGASGSLQGPLEGSFAAFVPIGNGRLAMLVSIASFYQAGYPPGITCQNLDGVASRDFNLQQALIVKFA